MLKPVTIRLDEDEDNKLKAQQESFGDPVINVAYVIRSCIRGLDHSCLVCAIQAGI